MQRVMLTPIVVVASLLSLGQPAEGQVEPRAAIATRVILFRAMFLGGADVPFDACSVSAAVHSPPDLATHLPGVTQYLDVDPAKSCDLVARRNRDGTNLAEVRAMQMRGLTASVEVHVLKGHYSWLEHYKLSLIEGGQTISANMWEVTRVTIDRPVHVHRVPPDR